MENNKEKPEAMENTQNSPEALSDEQLGAVTGAGETAFPAPACCEVCGSTNIVAEFHRKKGYQAWTCGDCGEILLPCFVSDDTMG